MDQIAFRPRDDESFTDRPAALRSHSSHRDRSRKLYSHYAPVKYLIVEEESILSCIPTSPGEAPDDFALRVPVGHEGEDILHRCREGISEKKKRRLLESRLRPPWHADLVLQVRDG